MKIGCQDHKTDDWLAFGNEKIDSMHKDAVKFWKKWKPVIQAIVPVS